MTPIDTQAPPPLTCDQLPPAVIALLQQGQQHVREGNTLLAMRAMRNALTLAPDAAEVLRWSGIAAQGAGNHAGAMDYFQRAVHARPDDAELCMQLGIAAGRAGAADAGIAAFTRACELAPDLVVAWYNLAEALKPQARTAEAIVALRRALDIDPAYLPAQISLARAFVGIGRIDAAAGTLRATLRQDPANAEAWWSLANLKTIPLHPDDVAHIERALQQPKLTSRARILLGFTLAHALESQNDYARAFDALSQANALQRRGAPWNGKSEHKRIEAIQRIFAQPMTASPDAASGREVIFIASLPRSGSSLIEQILASHPDIEGANEITCLKDVITAEAMRHRQPYPLWVPTANATDWQRLGADYLARTANWRQHKPRHTDKNLLNWMFVGPMLAMLPAAKVVIVRRDPVETCLACFRQWFENGTQCSCNLDDMADVYIDFWHLTRFWLQKHPQQVLDLEYEALLADPETSIRQLLDFCNLPFAPACLQFHRTSRTVLSDPSAAQVRQPLRRDTAHTARYGNKLDALRRRLREAGLPIASTRA